MRIVMEIEQPTHRVLRHTEFFGEFDLRPACAKCNVRHLWECCRPRCLTMFVSLRDTNTCRNDRRVIRSFKTTTTEAVFHGRCPKGFPPDIFPVARRKLGMLDAAVSLNSLRVPPANRLESLAGD